MFGPNASFGVQTTSMKKLSVFRISDKRLCTCTKHKAVIVLQRHYCTGVFPVDGYMDMGIVNIQGNQVNATKTQKVGHDTSRHYMKG
jgi:hypothetical protein